MKKFFATLSAAAQLTFSLNAQATAIVYGQTGTENPVEYTFTAASTGNLIGYFLGSTAAYEDQLTVLVNGVASKLQGLDNKTTPNYGSFNFGMVQAGDTLVFKLVTISGATGVGPWYSQTSMNSDGVNHVYATTYAGSTGIAAGALVAFEDLPNGGDFNYNDLNFYFANVLINAPVKAVTTNVPEPGSLALLGLGVVGFAASRKRAKSA